MYGLMYGCGGKKNLKAVQRQKGVESFSVL